MSTVNLRPNSPNSWHYRELNMKNPGLDHLSNGLISLVEAGRDIVAGSADLQYSNGLNRFAARFPDRYFSFGISEQNMVSAAAGIATTGTMPHVATLLPSSACSPASRFAWMSPIAPCPFG